MANKVYFKFKEAMATGLVDLSTATIKAQLIDTGTYTVDLAAHDFLDDVPNEARIGSPVTITGQELAAAVSDPTKLAFKSDPVAFSGVSSEEDVEALILYIDGVNDAARRLFFYGDTAGGSPGLPFLPQGNDITATPDPDEGWVRF